MIQYESGTFVVTPFSEEMMRFFNRKEIFKTKTHLRPTKPSAALFACIILGYFEAPSRDKAG